MPPPTGWRSSSAPQPTAAGRSSADRRDMGITGLISTIPFGVACWTADGRLIACNEQYRARLNAEPADVRIGASYAASVRRFVQGGYMQLIERGRANRVLELHREDGTLPAWSMSGRWTKAGSSPSSPMSPRRGGPITSSHRSVRSRRSSPGRYHEEKLKAEAASQSKTAFLAHLSHDIRTPSTTSSALPELMRHEDLWPARR